MPCPPTAAAGCLAFEQLVERHKALVARIVGRKVPPQEAVEALGWSQTTVKARAFRTRRKLQKLISQTMEARLD